MAATPLPSFEVSFVGRITGGRCCVRVRISRYGQPDASAGLPYHLLCMGSIGIARSLVTYRNSGQLGALLYIECQPLGPLRILGRRDSCALHRPVSTRSVPLGHESQPLSCRPPDYLSASAQAAAEPGSGLNWRTRYGREV